MNRKDIDVLISIAGDCEGRNSCLKNNEDICGWEIDSNQESHKNRPHFDTTSINFKSLKDRFKAKQPRNSTYDYAKPRYINLSPSNTRNKANSNLRNKFFPRIKNPVQSYAQEKSAVWNKFEVNIDRYVINIQDRSFRLTSATPIMLVRRKNLYY